MAGKIWGQRMVGGRPHRHSSRTRYLGIANVLRERIRTGAYQPGTAIPRNADLVVQFSSSSRTVQRATDILRGEGLIENRGRLGLVVRLPAARRKYTRVSENRYAKVRGGLTRRQTERAGSGGSGQTILSSEAVPAPAEIAPYFGLAPGDLIWCRTRRLWDDQGITELSRSWYALESVRGTALERPGQLRPDAPAGFVEVEANTGRAYTTAEDYWDIATPTERQMSELAMPAGEAVWLHTHVARDADGAVIEMVEAVIPGDRMRLATSYRIDVSTPLQLASDRYD